MKTYFILALAVAALSLIAAVFLLVKRKDSETRVIIAAILGGLALFLVMLALCLGFFMV